MYCKLLANSSIVKPAFLWMAHFQHRVKSEAGEEMAEKVGGPMDL
jgi:hypothetical protein